MSIVPAFVACNDFLNENPDSRTTLDSEEKIASLLISAYNSGAGDYHILTELSSDNVCDHGIKLNYSQFYQEVYEWADEITSNNDSPSNVWSKGYSCIANANQALQAIEELGGATTPSLKASKGEALIARAFWHFMLANIFCMPYNEDTADSYLGIPYMDHAETDLNPQYERGTLKEVYDKIRIDIEEGIPLIDDTQYSYPKWHFNYKAACTFASRFYLFTQDWDNVIKYSTAALTSNPTAVMRDNEAIAALTAGSVWHQHWVSSSSPANFLLQAATSSAGTVFGWYSTGGRYSHGALQAEYETVAITDTPYGRRSNSYFYIARPVQLSSSRKYILPRIWYNFQYTDAVAGTGYSKAISVLLSSEEALLNRAEAYAMKISGDSPADENLQLALADLNLWASNAVNAEYREDMTYDSVNRWCEETYPDYSSLYVGTTSTTTPQTLNPKKQLFPQYTINKGLQENMIQVILFIRRFQFMHEGMRWFDTRRMGITIYRYKLDEDDATVLQITDMISDEGGTPDLRRALQLPSDVIAAGLEPNPRK